MAKLTKNTPQRLDMESNFQEIESSLGAPGSLLRTEARVHEDESHPQKTRSQIQNENNEEGKTEEVSVPPKAIEYPNRLYVPLCGVIRRHVRPKQWNQRSYILRIKPGTPTNKLIKEWKQNHQPKESKTQ